METLKQQLRICESAYANARLEGNYCAMSTFALEMGRLCRMIDLEMQAKELESKGKIA